MHDACQYKYEYKYTKHHTDAGSPPITTTGRLCRRRCAAGGWPALSCVLMWEVFLGGKHHHHHHRRSG